MLLTCGLVFFKREDSFHRVAELLEHLNTDKEHLNMNHLFVKNINLLNHTAMNQRLDLLIRVVMCMRMLERKEQFILNIFFETQVNL